MYTKSCAKESKDEYHSHSYLEFLYLSPVSCIFFFFIGFSDIVKHIENFHSILNPSFVSPQTYDRNEVFIGLQYQATQSKPIARFSFTSIRQTVFELTEAVRHWFHCFLLVKIVALEKKTNSSRAHPNLTITSKPNCC